MRIKSKEIYCYDPSTLLFTGKDTVFESPLEPGVYLYPPNCTEDIPPEYDETTHNLIYAENSWSIIEKQDTALPHVNKQHEVRNKVEALLEVSTHLMMQVVEDVVLGEASFQDKDAIAVAEWRKQLRTSRLNSNIDKHLLLTPLYPNLILRQSKD